MTTSGMPSGQSPLELIAARMGARLLILLVTLWAGALWTVGFIVAPTLFEMLPERAMAGSVAGHLFGVLNWIGIVAGSYALLYFLFAKREGSVLADSRVWLVVVMLGIALAMQFGIQPLLADLRAQGLDNEAVRSRFGLWHGVSSLAYVVQSVMAVVLVLRAR